MIQTVPEAEIQKRIYKFQEDLQKKGLDGALILKNVNLFYFSGTIQSSVLFIPEEGEPILMVFKGHERVLRESPLKHILPVKGRAHIKKILRELKFNRSKIGMEMESIPVNLYLRYQQLFPEFEWVDVSESILKIRMIKSPYEVEQIRKAAQILHHGYLTIKEFIKEGMTELEVDGYLAFLARREGHMGVLRMRSWNQEMTHAHVLSGESGTVLSFLDSPHGGYGNTPAMAQGASFRRIRKNEPIGIDYGVGVNGYVADQFRTLVIGDLEDELKNAHELSVELHQLFVKEAKPGVSCSELYHCLIKKVRSAGLIDYFNGFGEGKAKFIGHGLGLEIDEYPIIAPRFNQKLQPGMVIALEPMFVFPGKGIVGLEDDYLITDSKVERLTLTEQKIIIV